MTVYDEMEDYLCKIPAYYVNPTFVKAVPFTDPDLSTTTTTSPVLEIGTVTFV